jgi:hypothetical protein
MSARFFAPLLLNPRAYGRRAGRAITYMIALVLCAPALAQPGPRRLTTRTGLPVVVVEAPGATWAVVQLHVRTAGEGLTAEQARGLRTFAAALARAGEGRGQPASDRVAAAGGETRVSRSLDSVVISDGLPAASIDEAIRAMDTRLRERRRLVPPLVAVPALEPPSMPPPPVVRQLMAPGHPYALPDDGATTPAVLTALSDRLLRRENVVLVVVAPDRTGITLARINRWLRAPLPRGALVVPAVGALDGGRVALAPSEGDDVLASLWLPVPAAVPAERSTRRAALLVLADLLGAEHGSAASLDWLVFDVHAREGPSGEQARLRELEAAARGLDDSAIAASRARARTALVRPRRAPEQLALVHGRRVLTDLDDDDVDQALVALPPETVRALAAELLKGGRVMLRRDAASEGSAR